MYITAAEVGEGRERGRERDVCVCIYIERKRQLKSSWRPENMLHHKVSYSRQYTVIEMRCTVPYINFFSFFKKTTNR